MKYVQIKDLGKIITGNTPKTSDLRNYEAKDINFIKPSDIVSFNYIEKIKNSEYFISEYARKNARIVPRNTVLVTCIGIIGKVAVTDKEVAFNQQINAIIPDIQKVDPLYLAYAISAKRKYIHDKANAAVVPIINKTNFSSLKIKLFSLTKQKEIVSQLDELDNIISLICQQLTKLDELVKSRFVEMFGDPVTNPHDWEKVPLSDLAEIKIGPFGTLLHKDDYVTGGHPLVNPSHIHDGTIVTDGKLTISDEKYEELSAYHLFENDVVMGRRGEMGRCAVVKEAGLLCGTGSMIIRSLGEVRADFLQKIISFPSFKKTIEDMAVGQTMPNLNVPIVSRLEIIKPPTEVQDAYYDFVALADKSKLVVQELLAKCELLRGKVMQEYFE